MTHFNEKKQNGMTNLAGGVAYKEPKERSISTSIPTIAL